MQECGYSQTNETLGWIPEALWVRNRNGKGWNWIAPLDAIRQQGESMGILLNDNGRPSCRACGGPIRLKRNPDSGSLEGFCNPEKHAAYYDAIAKGPNE